MSDETLIPKPRTRSNGSLALHAWAAVAACSLAIASTSGCLVSQDLGAEDAGNHLPDARGFDGATFEGGFDPQLTTPDYDVSKCPGVSPTPGQRCPINFLDKRDHLPVQCTYGGMIERLIADGRTLKLCGVSCMCGVDQTWSCIEAPCTMPMLRTCSEGTACLTGFECSYDCGGEGIGCQRCTCGDDQRLTCTRVTTK